jgi:hypothetical protein
MNKKLISLVMPVILLAFMCTLAGCATKPAISDDGLFEYNLFMGQVIITNYHGTATDVVIPDQINGKTVGSISAGAAANMGEADNIAGVLEGKSLTGVVFPKGLKIIIERRAFANNNLTSVTLSDGTSIGAAAFTGNPITSFTLGEGIKCGSRSLGTLTPYFFGNDKKPGIYTLNEGAWEYNGSACELPAIIKMDEFSISLIGFDGKSKGAMEGDLGEYKVSSEYWIPAGAHTLRVALPQDTSVTGVSVRGAGPSAELKGDFQAGIVYLVNISEDKTSVKITPQGPWSPPQE